MGREPIIAVNRSAIQILQYLPAMLSAIADQTGLECLHGLQKCIMSPSTAHLDHLGNARDHFPWKGSCEDPPALSIMLLLQHMHDKIAGTAKLAGLTHRPALRTYGGAVPQISFFLLVRVFLPSKFTHDINEGTSEQQEQGARKAVQAHVPRLDYITTSNR